MNKGIIVIGAAASGKSTLIKELNINEKFILVNPDIFVENHESEFYNNPLGASNIISKVILPGIINSGKDFCLDTTGANLNTLRKIIDNKQYNYKSIIVYCNPIIAFIRNFSRERRLPKQILLDLWLKVYSQINEYINMFGRDNIYVYETIYTKKEKNILLKFNSLIEYLIENTGEYNSTFQKDTTTYTVEQILKRESKFVKTCEEVDFEWLRLTELENFISQNECEIDDIKEELNKWI